ncbi:MAG: RHS repeat-associated core domain-containing protein [Thermoanaerobaculia bacterium]
MAISVAFAILGGMTGAVEALATCTPSVSASVSGMTLTIEASVTGPCGESGLSIYLDDDLIATKSCLSAHCNIVLNRSTACLQTGSHVVKATASCDRQQTQSDGTISCVSDTAGSSTASFTVNTTPTISIEYLGPSSTGAGSLSVTYDFPNTNASSQRDLYVYIDGNGWPNYYAKSARADQSGTWLLPMNTTCWTSGEHAIRVDAVACDKPSSEPGYRDRKDTSVTVNSTPDIQASYVGLDPTGVGQLDVGYSFPNTSASSQRDIYVYQDGAGWPNYSATTAAADQQGTWTVPLNTACWETGSHPIRIDAVSCDKPSSAPGYRDQELLDVTVDTTPNVGAVFVDPESDGIGAVSIDYSFPNTAASTQRDLYVYLDDAAHPNYHATSARSDQSGNWSVPLDVSCWTPGPHSARTVAVACDQPSTETSYRDTALAAIEVPPVSATIQNVQKSGGSYQATLFFAVPHATTDSPRPVDLLLRDPITHTTTTIWTATVTQPSSSFEVLIPVPPGPRILIARLEGCQPASDEVPLEGDNDCGCNDPENIGPSPSPAALNGPSPDAAFSDGNPAACSTNPVRYANGNMRYSDAEPLPALGLISLVRTYDSLSPTRGWFGNGWASALDASADAFGGIDGREFVTILDEKKNPTLFRRVVGGSSYVQVYPKGARRPALLTYDAATLSYRYRRDLAGLVLRYRASDWRLIEYSDLTTGRSVAITYDAGGAPTRISGSDGRAMVVTVDAALRVVTALAEEARPEIVWTYVYDSAGNLTSVLAPDGQQWRRYEYAAGFKTGTYGPADHLIESHTYDSAGRAMSSHGRGEHITSFQYDLPGRVPGETATVVTHVSGRIETVYLRYIAGRVRTVEVVNGCSSCGGSQAVYAYDASGFLVRAQDARGYITRIAHDTGGRVTTLESALRPAGCDPETANCRLSPDALATAALQATGATTTTVYDYASPTWPDRPTTVTRSSVLQPSQFVVESYEYHPVTGRVTRESRNGWTGDPPQQIERTVATETYDGLEAAVFDPGSWFAAWVALPQPAGETKRVNGPRLDVADVTEFVHYPDDASVPAEARRRLAARRDALGRITRYEDYDAFGTARRVTGGNGVVTTSTTDPWGRTTASTIEGLPGCDTALDPHCATALQTTTTYLPGGGPAALLTGPDGAVTAYEYDGMGRLHRVSRGPSGFDLRERIEYEWDALDRKIAESFWRLESGTWVRTRRTAFEYDDERLAATVHEDGARVEYAYDAADQLASTQDENHASPNTFYTYDPEGRLTSVRQTLGTGEAVTSYTYDIAGNLVSVTDPNGNVTSYLYDDFGQMLRQVSPVTGTTTYAYDPAGNMIATTDANGATTTRTYDVLGRVTEAVSVRSGTAAEMVSWTYDTGAFGIGRLARMDDPTGYTSYAWTRLGQLAREEKSVAGGIWATAFRYDLAGNRTSITYPSGRTVSSTYDFAGRPVTATAGATPLVTGATYLPFGPLTSLTYGNGTTKTMTYDARYRPMTNSLAGPLGTIAAYEYGYDPAGNITAITDLGDASYSRTFGYDDLHRLVTANTGASLWGTGTYQYDAMGNMTSLALGGRTATFGYAGTTPKLTTVTENGVPESVQYDAAGNETLVGTTGSSYTARNSLYESEGLRYAYDGRGVRTVTEVLGSQGASLLDDPNVPTVPASAAKSPVVIPSEAKDLNRRDAVEAETPSLLGSIIDRFFERPALSFGVEAQFVTAMTLPPAGSRKVNVYLPELQLLSESEFTAGTPVPAWDYVWFAGRPLAQIEVATGAIRWTFNDHLGTPVLQTDATGAVVWRLEQEPYGSEFAFRAGSALPQPLRFPGQEVGLDSSRSYNVFRWYRGGRGRYSQADPMGLSDGPNVYAYAAANPLFYIDPSGLKKCKCSDQCPSGKWVWENPTLSYGGGFLKGTSVTAGTLVCRDEDMPMKILAAENVRIECEWKGLMAGAEASFSGPIPPVPNACGCNEQDLLGSWSGWTFGVGPFGGDVGECSTGSSAFSGGAGVGASIGGGIAKMKCTTYKNWN